MVKFNIVFACLAIIGGLLNIYVGTLHLSNDIYGTGDLLSAVVQCILAVLLLITGLAKLGKILGGSFFGKIHIYVAIVFYAFGAIVIFNSNL